MFYLNKKVRLFELTDFFLFSSAENPISTSYYSTAYLSLAQPLYYPLQALLIC